MAVPKFVIGFFAASLLMTMFTSGYSTADFNSTVKPNLILPLVSLRTWAFIFCFMAIGLTTRFRELHAVGWKTFWAFTIGVGVNVLLGYVMSVHVFGDYWRRCNEGMNDAMTRSCGDCANFDNDPAGLEQAIPGLNILSSAFGSVRDETGLCRQRDAFVTPVYVCVEFRPRRPAEA